MITGAWEIYILKIGEKTMNFLTDLFTNKNDAAKVGLSQFKSVTMPIKKDNVSIMIITIDRDVNDETMQTINKIDGVKGAQYIKLNA